MSFNLSGGQFLYGNGLPIVGGTLTLILSGAATIIAGGGAAPASYTFTLDSNGAIIGPASVFGNAELSPAGTFYIATVKVASSTVWGPFNWAVGPAALYAGSLYPNVLILPPMSGGGGSISIAAPQVAFGTGVNTIGGGAKFTFGDGVNSEGVFLGLPSASFSGNITPFLTTGVPELQVNRLVLVGDSDTSSVASMIFEQTNKDIYTLGQEIVVDATDNISSPVVGAEVDVFTNVPTGQTNSYTQTGFEAGVIAYGAGTSTRLAAFFGNISNAGTGIVTDGLGFCAVNNNSPGGGSIINSFGFHSDDQSASGSTLTAAFHADAQTSPGYGFYSASAPNFFGGTQGTTFGGPIIMSTGQALSWNSDTGISRDSAGVIDIGNGTQGDKSGAINVAVLQAGAGTAGAPSINFVGGTTTGLYLISSLGSPLTTALGIAVNGSQIAAVDDNGITATGIACTLIASYPTIPGLLTAGNAGAANYKVGDGFNTRRIPMTLFTGYSFGATGNATALTSLFSSPTGKTGTLTLVPNQQTVGSVIHVKATGTITVGATSTVNFSLQLNGGVCSALAAASVTTAPTFWDYEAWIYCSATGIGGTATMQSVSRLELLTANGTTVFGITPAVTQLQNTVNTTIFQLIDLKMDFGTGNASDTCQMLVATVELQ